MRRNELTRGRNPSLATALVLAAGLSSALHGQTRVNPGSQGIPAAGNQAQVSWVGCLMRVDKQPSRPGTGDNTEEGKNDSSRFVLKDASPANARNDRATREIGLRTSKVDLAAHAGHQVELTGRFVDARTATGAGAPASGSKDSSARGTAGTTPPSTSANPQATILEVTAARTTSPDCQSR